MLKMGFAVVFYRPDENNNIYSDAYVGANVGITVGINETKQKILSLLSEKPKLTAQQLSAQLGISTRRVESNIKSLKDLNLIERVGAAKNGHWIVMQAEDKRGDKNG